MRVTLLAALCAVAGCNFRIDPLGGVGSSGSGSDGSVDAGGDDLADLAFALAGDLAHPGPFLTLTAMPSAAAADLTIDGSADWAHWGYAAAGDFEDKSGGGQISNFQQVGVNAPAQYGDGRVSYHWSDGASGSGRHPSSGDNGSTSGVYVLTGGLAITAPADATVRRLKLYVGQLDAEGQLDASLSDNSAPSVSDHSNTSTNGTPVNVTYVLTYAASGPGQLVKVSWSVVTNSLGNITLQSASLQAPEL